MSDNRTLNLEDRLDRLGAAAEEPRLDEHGAFMAGVRRRGRARAVRNTLIAGGGVALAAAAVLVAALVNPPRAQPEEPVVGPVAVAAPELPTIGELSRVSWGVDGLDELPLFDGGSGPVDEPVNAGSSRVAEELMGL